MTWSADKMPFGFGRHSSNINEKEKHPFGKASRWGVFVSNESKCLVDTRDEVFHRAADLFEIYQPVALFLAIAEREENDAAEAKLA